jgi:hypothetical protein
MRLPSTVPSIHFNSISSCSALNASAPSMPMPPARLTAATTSRQWLNAKIEAQSQIRPQV